MRNLTLDIARGLAIITVPIQHVMIKIVPGFGYYWVYNFVISWSMPLFFAVSGYLAYVSLSKQTNLWKWIGKKALYLLPIQFAFNLLVWFWFPTNLSEWAIHPMSSYAEWNVQTIVFDHGVWFFWVLFFIFGLLAVAYRYRGATGYCILASAIMFQGITPLQANVNDYFRLDYIAYYFPYAFAGFSVAGMNLKGLPIRLIAAVLAGVYILSGVSSHWIPIGWSGYVMGFSLLPLLVYVSYLLSRFTVGKILAYIGTLTYGVYIFSQLFTNVGIGNGWVRVISAVVFSLLIGVALTIVSKWVIKAVRQRMQARELSAVRGS